jgi:hypothetical protein
MYVADKSLRVIEAWSRWIYNHLWISCAFVCHKTIRFDNFSTCKPARQQEMHWKLPCLSRGVKLSNPLPGCRVATLRSFVKQIPPILNWNNNVFIKMFIENLLKKYLSAPFIQYPVQWSSSIQILRFKREGNFTPLIVNVLPWNLIIYQQLRN